jgi:hypothetical protein
LETPGISIYLIHCILLRLMYRYPYPFFSAMGRDQTSTSNRIDGTPNSSSNRNWSPYIRVYPCGAFKGQGRLVSVVGHFRATYPGYPPAIGD